MVKQGTSCARQVSHFTWTVSWNYTCIQPCNQIERDMVCSGFDPLLTNIVHHWMSGLIIIFYNTVSLTNWKCWSRWSLTINTLHCWSVLYQSDVGCNFGPRFTRADHIYLPVPVAVGSPPCIWKKTNNKRNIRSEMQHGWVSNHSPSLDPKQSHPFNP